MKLGHGELELLHFNIYNQEKQWNDKSGMILSDPNNISIYLL